VGDESNDAADDDVDEELLLLFAEEEEVDDEDDCDCDDEAELAPLDAEDPSDDDDNGDTLEGAVNFNATKCGASKHGELFLCSSLCVWRSDISYGMVLAVSRLRAPVILLHVGMAGRSALSLSNSSRTSSEMDFVAHKSSANQR
jgi:hypothetical protein